MRLKVRAPDTSSLEIYFEIPNGIGHFPPGVVPHIRYRSQYELEAYAEALTAEGSLAALRELRGTEEPSRESFVENDPRQGWIDLDVGGVVLKDEEGFQPNYTRVIPNLLANTEYFVEVRLLSKVVSFIDSVARVGAPSEEALTHMPVLFRVVFCLCVSN